MADACHASAQISLVHSNQMGKLVKIDAVAHRCDEYYVVNRLYGLFGSRLERLKQWLLEKRL